MRLTRRSFAALLLAGCAGPEPLTAAVDIAPDVAFRLPAPDALGVVLEAAQSITAAIEGERRFAFANQVAVAPAQLLLVALDPLGRRAMTLRWNGAALQVERADWLPAAIRPGNVIADLMLLYAPAAPIRRGLAAAAASLSDAPLSRQVTRGNDLLVRIDYDSAAARRWQGRAQVRNLAYGYVLDIQSTVLPA